MNLHDLQRRRKKRVKKRKRHYRKYVNFRAKKQPKRRDYHLKKFQAQIAAIEKIDRLIESERERLEDLKIDWSGKPPLTYEPLLKTIRYVQRVVPAVFVTSTNGGTHSSTSWHYQNRAWDGGSDGSRGEEPEKEAQEALLKRFGAHYFAELFGPCNWYIKNGVKYSGTFPNHGDHLHVAVA